MRSLLCAAGGLLWTIFATPSALADLVLVENGKAAASIVIAPGSSVQVRRAGQVLQDYVAKSTGARLEIVDRPDDRFGICLGTRTGSGGELSDPESYLIESSRRRCLIAGGSDWGLEFGVDEFLERYVGVRWLMPTEMGEDVPRLSRLAIPEGRWLGSPAFRSRQLSPFAVNSESAGPADAGGEWARFNRARSRLAFHHNLLNLYPAAEFAGSHPEFYPWVNGTRLIPIGSLQGFFRWQPNFSAPGLAQAGFEGIDRYFQAHPEEESYSLGMNDSTAFDESPESKQRRSGRKNYLNLEDVSDDYFQWANEVAALVLAKYPGKWFGTLAYNNIAEPPEHVAINRRIIPVLTYERMRWADPKLREFGERITLQWLKAAPEIGWYDYAWGAQYSLPRVWFHTLQDYLRWGAAHGVRFNYAELYPNWGEGPKAWVYAKLLWDPAQDVDRLLDDWYFHAVGPAAAPSLKEFYRLWEEFWTVTALKSAWNREDGQYLSFNDQSYLLLVSDAMMARCDHLLDESVRLAGDDRQRARGQVILRAWKFYKASILAFRAHQAGLSARARSAEEALDCIRRGLAATKLGASRMAMLAGFRGDPLFGVVERMHSDNPYIDGRRWGSGYFWTVLEWARRDRRVCAALQEAAGSSNALTRFNASVLLALTEGRGEPMLRNGEFGSGQQAWVITGGKAAVSGGDEPALQVFGNPKTGEVAISQEFQLSPGDYCLVFEGEGKGAAKGKGTIALKAVEQAGKNFWRQNSSYPSASFPLEVGNRIAYAIPFQVPGDQATRAVVAKFSASGLAPGDEVALRNFEVRRVSILPSK